jgi:hypothetical protein
MGADKLTRESRSGRLDPETVARDEELRRKVQREFPPARASLPVSDSLSEALRQAVAQSGQSIDQICRAAGVSQLMLTGFLAENRDIPMTVADKLASVLHLKLTVG